MKVRDTGETDTDRHINYQPLAADVMVDKEPEDHRSVTGLNPRPGRCQLDSRLQPSPRRVEGRGGVIHPDGGDRGGVFKVSAAAANTPWGREFS